jgi:hypothetical protein
MLLFIGGSAVAAFGLIGSSIDADGFLREPFALLPVGCALIALGSAMVMLAALRLAGGK